MKKRIIAAALSLCIILQSVIVSVMAEDISKSVEDVIREGFYSFSESIDIREYKIPPSELTRLVSSVIKDDPYLFFVNWHMSFSFVEGGHVLSLRPTYNMTEEEVFFALEYCKERAREIASAAADCEGQGAMALFVHDYICYNFGYDETMESDDLLDFFKSGKGTCQGYAAAYMAVLRELGIPCHYVASDTISHIWNLVEIDGEWYHVDLTWDDSTGEGSRRHFLLSDRLAEERGHRDWYSSVRVVCDSEKFDGEDFDSWLIGIHNTGDCDHDGEIGLADLLRLRRRISRGDFGDTCSFCADLDGDGFFCNGDIALLRKKLLCTD